jgi:hypothetical protein
MKRLLLTALFLSMRAHTCFDDLGNKEVALAGGKTSTTGGGTGTLFPCLPLRCGLVCNGSVGPEGGPETPGLDPACSLEFTDATLLPPALRHWIDATLALPCPPASPAMVVRFPVPQQFACAETTCASSPDLLPPSCSALCTVNGGIPDPVGCPDPATNQAMQDFLDSLAGIACNNQASTNPYWYSPDPALVDHGVCMHRPPHPPTSEAQPRD